MITPQSTTSELCDDPGYSSLKRHIIEMTGLSYYADKDKDLAQRIARRLQELPETDCGTYLELLLQDAARGAAELGRLVDELTIGETSFFRHPELFDGLRDSVLPDLLARNRTSRRLRIWSAGCSNGAEAYSLAILLAQEFRQDTEGWEVSILGTDINRQFLARARQGVFRQWDFRGFPQLQIDECFDRHGDEWHIRDEYRRDVNFQYHNLVRNTFPSLPNNLVAFDLILCRNVLIYFNRELIGRVVSQFHECLVEGGWLLVGHAEPNVELFRLFQTVNAPGAVLYQKGEGSTSETIPAPGPTAQSVFPITALPASEIQAACQGALPEVSATCPSPGRPEPIRARPVPREEALPENTNNCDAKDLLRKADLGDLDTAMEGFLQLAANDPMDPIPHLHIGMIAEQLGNRKQAEASLRRTLYLDPSNILAHYYCALLQQRQGFRSQAETSCRNALRLLSAKEETDSIPGAKGLTVVELHQLLEMHMEVLQDS